MSAFPSCNHFFCGYWPLATSHLRFLGRPGSSFAQELLVWTCAALTWEHHQLEDRLVGAKTNEVKTDLIRLREIVNDRNRGILILNQSIWVVFQYSTASI